MPILFLYVYKYGKGDQRNASVLTSDKEQAGLWVIFMFLDMLWYILKILITTYFNSYFKKASSNVLFFKQMRKSKMIMFLIIGFEK